MKWYAVRVGDPTGIFATWAECKAATNGYRGARFRSFGSRELAQQWLDGPYHVIPTGPPAPAPPVALAGKSTPRSARTYGSTDRKMGGSCQGLISLGQPQMIGQYVSTDLKARSGETPEHPKPSTPHTAHGAPCLSDIQSPRGAKSVDVPGATVLPTR